MCMYAETLMDSQTAQNHGRKLMKKRTKITDQHRKSSPSLVREGTKQTGTAQFQVMEMPSSKSESVLNCNQFSKVTTGQAVIATGCPRRTVRDC